MYNRYIPQSDGTYRRRPSQEATHPIPEKQQEPGASVKHTPEPATPPPQPRADAFGLSSFLRQLLPKSFDIGDLIVVLLLLLMAADRQEEQNSALLTLALYLFL